MKIEELKQIALVAAKNIKTQQELAEFQQMLTKVTVEAAQCRRIGLVNLQGIDEVQFLCIVVILPGLFPPLPSVICPDLLLEIWHFVDGDKTGGYRAMDVVVDLLD